MRRHSSRVLRVASAPLGERLPEALQRGGTAADAALATALAQIVLKGGATISYAGILTVVYYDAASKKVYSLNAGYNTLLEEKYPTSVPRDKPSGRTALVPGFFAGVQAAHGRFGKLPFASLLEPGTFDPARMDSAAYPGVALFTVMPGPLPATRAFDELLDTARALAHRLGGQLQDDRGAPLSVQRVFKLREEVIAFERTLGSAGGA